MIANSVALHFKDSEQKDAWDFLSLWSNWNDFFFILAACTMTTGCSLLRQMVLPASSANVRNYNNPAGMKRGDRAKYSGESK